MVQCNLILSGLTDYDIGATTAEKLEGTYRGEVDVDSLLFPFPSLLTLLSLFASITVSSTLFLHPLRYLLTP